MGLFDKMFGRGASEAQQQQGTQQRFNELKSKYQSVLNTADQQNILDPNEYMRIFYANRDKLRDPDKIQVGQQLVIPPADKS